MLMIDENSVVSNDLLCNIQKYFEVNVINLSMG